MGDKTAIIKRLRRVEGQIKGIQKMVDEEKFCGDILIQVAAARAALNSVGGLVLENYMKNCLKDYLQGESEEAALDKLVDVMLKYTKQN
ncbi:MULTISPECIES: metal-sensitive transcriptional regulator [Tissierella]|uniref:DNA-binding transcriptional regulator, FrmR family n=1 Tax=Tissierella praeacuta DSM 18095 TaxID=1123404 RepID=A0A1M4ZEH6_9FIRM|nr:MULTISPECIES: metal-sensitive transcriptional regulator [Tissierella]TCU65383.1 DNA-binding FrmR family transcriptional regulator [Tissierella praeacuta]SHF16207.1 DNA-binding transcriptional regulator, FrmR family [Tissierella praeacuta DSM 18095]SUP01899.1 Copper-sensitive operon repressor [Tissierella praeacuta]